MTTCVPFGLVSWVIVVGCLLGVTLAARCRDVRIHTGLVLGVIVITYTALGVAVVELIRSTPATMCTPTGLVEQFGLLALAVALVVSRVAWLHRTQVTAAVEAEQTVSEAWDDALVQLIPTDAQMQWLETMPAIDVTSAIRYLGLDMSHGLNGLTRPQIALVLEVAQKFTAERTAR